MLTPAPRDYVHRDYFHMTVVLWIAEIWVEDVKCVRKSPDVHIFHWSNSPIREYVDALRKIRLACEATLYNNTL